MGVKRVKGTVVGEKCGHSVVVFGVPPTRVIGEFKCCGVLGEEFRIVKRAAKGLYSTFVPQ